jgi:hypothetical protein
MLRGKRARPAGWTARRQNESSKEVTMEPIDWLRDAGVTLDETPIGDPPDDDDFDDDEEEDDEDDEDEEPLQAVRS